MSSTNIHRVWAIHQACSVSHYWQLNNISVSQLTWNRFIMRMLSWYWPSQVQLPHSLRTCTKVITPRFWEWREYTAPQNHIRYLAWHQLLCGIYYVWAIPLQGAADKEGNSEHLLCVGHGWFFCGHSKTKHLQSGTIVWKCSVVNRSRLPSTRWNISQQSQNMMWKWLCATHNTMSAWEETCHKQI